MNEARILAAASSGTNSHSTSPDGDLVDVRRRVVDDDAEVAEGLGHDPDVLDLGDVREPAALAGQGRRGEQLQGGVLRRR